MTERAGRYFEDFTVGERFTTAGITLTEASIIDFAFKYDPQPFHIDVEAARQSHFGGLVASGFQTLACAFRMLLQENLIGDAGMGSPGMDELRWLKPVYAGDTIFMEMEILALEASASRSDRGRARCAYTVRNQRAEAVMTVTAIQLLKRRPSA